MLSIPRIIQISSRLPYNLRCFSEEAAKDSGKIEPTMMVHGGAGALFDSIVVSKLEGVKAAVQVGYKALIKGNAADAVEQAIRCMDDSDHFNSGKGSMLTVKGEVENDAVIMSGNLNIGAVSCCQNIEHPISLSRLIMDKAPCSLLSGAGATEFASRYGMKILEPGALVTPRAKHLLENFKKFEGMETGIVGAVALDKNGMLCAGTSSGGPNSKPSGRSCCCLAGCQVYTHNAVGAVALTGEGESILRTCLAYLIISNIKNGLSPSEAIQKGLFLMDMRLHTAGGAIALGRNGEIGFYFNTKRMPWAYQVGNSIHFGVEKGEHNIEETKI